MHYENLLFSWRSFLIAAARNSQVSPPQTGAFVAAVLLYVPSYVAVVSYAVAFVLGLVKIFSFNNSPCAAVTVSPNLLLWQHNILYQWSLYISFNLSFPQNTAVDVVFLLAAGGSVITGAYYVSGFSFAAALLPPIFGPIAAELGCIVLAVGFYVSLLF